MIDGLDGYAFSFSAHWTRVESANLYTRGCSRGPAVTETIPLGTAG